MRLVATRSIEAGVKLAKAIYNEKGKILVNEGVVLNKKVLKRIYDLGIMYLYVHDERTKDIHYVDTISSKVKREAIHSIENTFNEVQKDMKATNSFIFEKTSQSFSKLTRQLITEVKNHKGLIGLLSDVYIRDQYVFSHSLNVALYSLAIGMELKLPPKDLEILGIGAILHDVGKMTTPKEILLKPGQLTKKEFEEVKRHPEVGFQLLKNVSTLSLLVAHCAYQHHERLNGSGYPRGIKGDEIHLFAKIIAVSDVFDAITSHRVYRKAMLPHEGLDFLYSGAGTLFEREIIEAFRRSVTIYPVGLTVELSNKKKGVVSKQNKGLSDRPVVKILEHDGVPIDAYELDLMSELSVVITNCDATYNKG
ncbi:HD-GYP domain-containing protein [Bacillus sp. 03113]|uniref:HD-GYP domain-containing protein n=1 Tax=Bacillus sp. 03113 TaxID=2578211 RepID=UPI00114334B7|nr:HD-GYP domain-containing protein [Bacillus sp. 03113]